MEQRSVILNFPKESIEQPVISNVIKKFGIDINILQAKISPEEDGYMFAIIKGDAKSLKESLSYIKKLGVITKLLDDNITKDDKKCTNCGACIAHCIPGALSMDKKSYEILFETEKCIGCELCLSACAYNAITSEVVNG